MDMMQQHSEEPFRQVVEMAPNAIVMIDKHGKMEMLNAQAEKIFKYDRSELLGQSIEILLPERFRQRHPQLRESFFSVPSPRPMGSGRDLFGRRKDGSEFPVEIGLNPINTVGGMKVLAAIVDISERRRQETQFRQVVEMAPYSMLLVDNHAIVSLVNPEACNLFGVPREELIGKQIQVWLPDLDLSPQALRAFDEPRPALRTWARHADGNSMAVEISLTPMDAQGAAAALVTIIDIRERLAAQQRIENQVKKLIRINEEVNSFSYVASHDLKSPLRGIDQLASWIAEDLADVLNPETREHLRLMRSRIKRMDRLLDDLLAYSRAGRHDDEIVVINVRSLLIDIIDLMATQKRIDWRLADNLPTIATYKVPLDLVFRNLISNAIKHHDKENARIQISARAIDENGAKIEFSITDNGPGIAPEHQERVFAMFQTLKPRDEVEGSGIGLAMVRKTVESFGGKVTLESDGQNGSTFRFTWPIVSVEKAGYDTVKKIS